jgi:hypothetical protein
VYLPKRWPQKYGIETPMATSLIGQLLQPFERKSSQRKKQIVLNRK